MRTFKRICVEDYVLEENGDRLILTRGREYVTSAEYPDGTVTVFTSVWARVRRILFAGPRVFTES